MHESSYQALLASIPAPITEPSSEGRTSIPAPITEPSSDGRRTPSPTVSLGVSGYEGPVRLEILPRDISSDQPETGIWCQKKRQKF